MSVTWLLSGDCDFLKHSRTLQSIFSKINSIWSKSNYSQSIPLRPHSRIWWLCKQLRHLEPTKFSGPLSGVITFYTLTGHLKDAGHVKEYYNLASGAHLADDSMA